MHRRTNGASAATANNNSPHANSITLDNNYDNYDNDDVNDPPGRNGRKTRKRRRRKGHGSLSSDSLLESGMVRCLIVSIVLLIVLVAFGIMGLLRLQQQQQPINGGEEEYPQTDNYQGLQQKARMKPQQQQQQQQQAKERGGGGGGMKKFSELDDQYIAKMKATVLEKKEQGGTLDDDEVKQFIVVVKDKMRTEKEGGRGGGGGDPKRRGRGPRGDGKPPPKQPRGGNEEEYAGLRNGKKRTQKKPPRNPKDLAPLGHSDIYLIPNSLSQIGDKSDEYAILRMGYDRQHPFDSERSLNVTEQLRKYDNKFEVVENPLYDVHNCPDQPPKGYPYEWNTRSLLKHWKPDDTNIPSSVHQGLCVFDYRRDYIKASNYRRTEVPFVIRGDPEVAQTVERWNSPGYMNQLLRDDVQHRAEYSENNHFMYWRPDTMHLKKPSGWKPPTKMIRMTYQDWVQHANVTDERLLGPDQPHWYFRLIGCGETGPQGECDAGSSEYLFDELTFFQPRPGLLYMVEPHEQKGLHCRFGMKGVIAENHFDSSRNAIAVLGGERRYILSHPKHCRNFGLLPLGHPSARHSAVDWNDPDLEKYPEFAEATSNEVVLQAGDVLYLPTNWFHYIISLSMNFQCNSRSGTTDDYTEHISKCGFSKG